MEAQILQIIKELFSSPEKTAVSVKEITACFGDRFGKDYDNKVTAQLMGSIIRKRLGLKTQKTRNGRSVITLWEIPTLHRLYEKYGISNGGTPESPKNPETMNEVNIVNLEKEGIAIENPKNKGSETLDLWPF